MRYSLIFITTLLVLCGCGSEKFVSYYEGTSQAKEVGYQNEQGQKVGEWSYYNQDGEVIGTITHRDGKPWSGTEFCFWPNGQAMAQFQYKHGALHGELIRYDESGNITNQGVYEEGKHISGDDFEETDEDDESFY